jgi:glycine dehydrogenase subunit 2
MSRFTFQPGGGAHAIFANALMMRAYHASRGEGDQRDEVITTVFSHPADAACPATAGYKIITLYPGARGYPDLDSLKAVVSERTAGLMITNPEDTGIFNPEIDRFCEVVHAAGGLCAYDQANANGLLGVARARDAGFDLCQFNLHKTFASAHCAMGMSCGAAGVSAELERFLPAPVISRVGDRLVLDHDRPDAITRLRSFYGVPATVVRSYAWVMALGADGLRDVAHGAVMNNNYLADLLRAIDGVEVSYESDNAARRLEQVRYSWQGLEAETGVGTLDISRRTADFGVTAYMTSHHPWLVAEPMTLEPTECYSRADLDAYAAMLATVAEEARESPARVRSAPHTAAMHRLDEAALSDPARWATTWRAYRRKNPKGITDPGG